MVKVVVNSENCIACGLCVNSCPNVFAFGEDYKSHVKKQPETEEDVKCAKEAAEACPVQAIKVEKEEG